MPFSLVFSAVPLGKIRVQAKENLLGVKDISGIETWTVKFTDYLLLPAHLFIGISVANPFAKKRVGNVLATARNQETQLSKLYVHLNVLIFLSFFL